MILPIASLTYLESSLEFRRPAWSIPPPQETHPVLAAGADVAAKPGELIEKASGVHRAPLPRRPSPSGVHSARA